MISRPDRIPISAYLISGLLLAVLLLPSGCKPPRYTGSLLPYLKGCAASSHADEHSPDAALDSDLQSGWYSAPDDDKNWIELNFSEPVTIRRITVFWGSPRAADYALLTPADNYVWTEAGHIIADNETIDNIQLSKPVTTDTLRLRIYQPEAPCLINEIQIIGSAPYRKGIRTREDALSVSTPEPEPSPTLPPPPPTPRPEDIAELERSDNPVTEADIALNEELLMLAAADPQTADGMTDDEFLDLVARRTFGFFWWETNPETGLTRDRARNFEPSSNIKHSSVAATGFALAAYVIGVERGWVTRQEALERVRNTLHTFESGMVRNIHGIFPHFVNMDTGQISPGSEYSTIDTALLLAGMIVAMEYFDDPVTTHKATRIFNRINWPLLRFGDQHFVSHGLTHSRQHFPARWGTMSEGIMIYYMAPGSPSFPLPPSAWYAIDRHRDGFAGYDFYAEYGFQSIFRFQYPALFFDFRGITDNTGIDYFHNVRVAILAMREYCIRQADFFPKAYGPDRWGLGAADGPGNRYYIYGFPPGEPYSPTDGSIIPYAIAGSIPFVPHYAIRALRRIYNDYRAGWGKYGFADCINPEQDFIAQDVLGLDAGTILLGIDNYQHGLIWKLFMQNKWIQRSMKKIGMKKALSPFNRTSIDLMTDGRWLFNAGDGEFSEPTLDDSAWQLVDIPEKWEHISPEMKDYDGIGWYRCHLDIDPAILSKWKRSGKPLGLMIGGIDDGDITWLNGQRIGATPPGKGSYNKLRVYRIQPDLLQPRNLIAIKVVDREGSGGLWLPPVELGILRNVK
jgi:hypothetical protein